MELTIWKYTIMVNDTQKVLMPKDAKLLSVQVQHNTINLWAMVNPMNETVRRVIQMAGTGHDMSERIMGNFLGTIQLDEGAFVCHVFDFGEE